MFFCIDSFCYIAINLKTTIMQINFYNYEFDGLEIFRYVDYPWKSKREKDSFYDNLLNSLSDCSREKFKLFNKKESEELIHVHLSRSFLSGIIGVSLILIATILSLILPFIITSIIIGASLYFMVLRWLFRRKATKCLTGIERGDGLIDFMFDTEISVSVNKV